MLAYIDMAEAQLIDEQVLQLLLQKTSMFVNLILHCSYKYFITRSVITNVIIWLLDVSPMQLGSPITPNMC
jgi:hypothetical protein